MGEDKQNLNSNQIFRAKAEKQLEDNHIGMSRIPTEIEIEKLVHELQVHQIELEMQNEELRQANETAGLALKKYTMLYDFAPMGYFTLNVQGLICDLNFTGAELLGEKRFSLINSKFRLFVSNDSLPVFDHFFCRIFKGEAKESCKIMIIANQEDLCPVYMEGIITEDKQECLLSVIDISGFKK